MNLVKLLANNWQPIAIIALVGTGLAVSHHQGYKSAFAKQQAVIDKMEHDKAQALLLSAQNYARELEQARAEAKKYEVKAHAVGMALAQKQAEVSRLKILIHAYRVLNACFIQQIGNMDDKRLLFACAAQSQL